LEAHLDIYINVKQIENNYKNDLLQSFIIQKINKIIYTTSLEAHLLWPPRVKEQGSVDMMGGSCSMSKENRKM